MPSGDNDNVKARVVFGKSFLDRSPQAPLDPVSDDCIAELLADDEPVAVVIALVRQAAQYQRVGGPGGPILSNRPEVLGAAKS